jgi:C-terminal processing protease CtpA/Prc
MEFSFLVDEDGHHTLEVGATYDTARWPFQPGDRIVSVGSDRESLTTLTQFVTAIRGRFGAVPIHIERGRRPLVVMAHPIRRASVVARRGVSIDGALIAPMSFEDAAVLSKSVRLVVQSVESGSSAEVLGVEAMDMLETIDGRHFDDLNGLLAYLDRHQEGVPIRAVFRRVSPAVNRWFELQARDLPGRETRVIEPDAPEYTARR